MELLGPMPLWLLGLLLSGLYIVVYAYGPRPRLTRGAIASKPLDQSSGKNPGDTNTQEQDWSVLDFSNTKPISPDFNWSAAAEVPYRPWRDGPHRVTMALQKTTLDDWVEIDKTYLERYQYKRKLFAEHREETLQHLSVADEASFEALYYLVDFLPRRYPSMFTKTDAGITNLVTGDDWDLRRDSKTWESYHPLQVMSLLSTEDWLILQTDQDGQTTRLNAGANCFPAGWRLQDRIGHSLWQIHAGIVPHYEENLAKSMDRYFLRIPASKPIMRLNYSFQCSSELFQISSHHNLESSTAEKPLTIDQVHLRVERQYLQRLPKTQALVFSIRTYMTPITEVTKDKERTRALRTSIGGFSPQLATYKSRPVWGEVLDEHIKEVLGE